MRMHTHTHTRTQARAHARTPPLTRAHTRTHTRTRHRAPHPPPPLTSVDTMTMGKGLSVFSCTTPVALATAAARRWRLGWGATVRRRCACPCARACCCILLASMVGRLALRRGNLRWSTGDPPLTLTTSWGSKLAPLPAAATIYTTNSSVVSLCRPFLMRRSSVRRCAGVLILGRGRLGV